MGAGATGVEVEGTTIGGSVLTETCGMTKQPGNSSDRESASIGVEPSQLGETKDCRFKGGSSMLGVEGKKWSRLRGGEAVSVV